MTADDPVSRYRALFRRSHPGYVANIVPIAPLRVSAERWFRGTVLDVGCGLKRMETLVGDTVDRYVGLDHEGSLHDPDGADLIGTAYRIPSPDNHFQSLLCTSVLEHLEEPADALAEAFRVLEPGGVALYTAQFFWHVHEAPRDFYRYTRHGLEHLFAQAGFEVLEVGALCGFWVTFTTELNYYLRRFARGPLKPLIGLWTLVTGGLALWLDRGPLRDERFALAYLVAARKPEE